VTKQITGFSVDFTDLAFIDFGRKKLKLKVSCSMVYEKCAKLQHPCTVGDPQRSHKVSAELTLDTNKAEPAWAKEEGLSGKKYFENPWGQYAALLPCYYSYILTFDSNLHISVYIPSPAQIIHFMILNFSLSKGFAKSLCRSDAFFKNAIMVPENENTYLRLFLW
jgi:hypothetical protein